ncbi:polar amino acid transport system substrate-binding protein [Oscillibacter sp. PC13]|nr:polar amino acid transport system substrate-binding protein [Oscillibacter sp. PC13]
MKNMKKVWALLLALAMTASMAACGGSGSDTQTPADNADNAAPEEETTVVYAVEAGSAGEAAAQENGFEMNSVGSQADALMEVQAGTSDAAIIDSLMAGAMVGEGTSYPDLKVTDQKLTEELYGVGCRKGSDLASYINMVFGEAYADGSMQEIATTYGVQEALVEQAASEFTAAESDSDVAYIQDKGTLIIGITDFEPMDYQNDSGEWIGFDADMAKLVAEKLGVEAQFIVIDWDSKIMELDSKNIDVVWNGMTLTDAVLEAMECTNAYCNNAQVVVTK